MSFVIIIALFVLVCGAVGWFGRRSGVTGADLRRELPGDDMVEVPSLICDRAVVLNASAQTVWPWVVQLGKERAGWYAPRWVEALVGWPRRKRGARTILPQFQKLEIGEVLPDWGGGGLRPVMIEPGRVLAYQLVRPPYDPSARPRFSWVHVLEPIDETHCRLYIRLRGSMGSKSPLLVPLHALGGFFDYLTIVVVFAGLRERLPAEK